MVFRDHFSDTAEHYVRYRPHYPPALFDFLAEAAPARDRAWDCGTGNGQAAVDLAKYFEAVLATDGSPQQLGRRRERPNVHYALCAAEAAPLASQSLDLVTAAQAVHWFEIDGFYGEVRRVLVPDGIVAVWSYNLCSVAPPIDRVVRRFYREVVGPFWPVERQVVESGYSELPFPFEELEAPDFDMRASWRLGELTGYLSTWSSARAYRQVRGSEPIDQVMDELTAAWGDPERSLTVRWRVGLRVGQVRA